MKTMHKRTESDFCPSCRSVVIALVVYAAALLIHTIWPAGIAVTLWGHLNASALKNPMSEAHLETLFMHERAFTEQTLSANFYFGFGGQDDEGQTAATGFLVAPHPLSTDVIILTAAHVVALNPSMTPGDRTIVIFPRGKAQQQIPVDLKVSTTVDLAAAWVLRDQLQDITPGALYSTDGDRDLIRGVTPLAILCNPSRFSVPVRSGVFDGFNDMGYLTVKFQGFGPQNGCSGGPIVDAKMRVRALATQAGTHFAAGVPSRVIAIFFAHYLQ